MIKTFIGRLFGARPAAEPAAAAPPEPPPLGVRTEIGADDHRIDPTLLDDNAVRVVRTLKDAGHEAYIVGGAVRDLLVGLRPKDFDVATDATPEQVKSLFRRAFIIGRRFRLVHVVFGRGREHEVIEVSTFRALLDANAADTVAGNEKTSKHELADKTHVVDAAGRVLRDNVWGPQNEDAARRDFTVNAMYYDPVTQIVVDYHGGLPDARARVLRMIGDPDARYREDPVRIVRVVRFAAKLGFDIDPATRKPIAAMAALLANVPASRMFDEMVKLLQTGHAVRSIDELRKQGLLGGALRLFPVLDAVYGAAEQTVERTTFVRLALENTDRRVADGRAVVPSFLLACMLWHDVQARWSALRDGGEAPYQALQLAVDAVFDARIGDISGRGKLAADMREVWLMQPRFERRSASSARALIAQPRFRAGYDFLRLRADTGDLAAELADWWEDFHLGSDDEREALLADLKPAPKRVRAVRPMPDMQQQQPAVADAGAPSTDGSARAADTAAGTAADTAADAPPRKRRRRRRKPAAAGAADAPEAPDTPDA